MFTKNIFNQKSDAIVDMINKINEADYKLKMEALKGDQHKIDKNKNGKVDAQDFKILRKDKKVEEASPFDWKNTPSQLKKKPGESTGHESKKTSTGTQYTKKAPKKSVEEGFNLEDMDPALVEEFMQTEEFEQLDELSKKTLKSYTNKAAQDAVNHVVKSSKHDDIVGQIKSRGDSAVGANLTSRNSAASKKAMDHAVKRVSGMEKAAKRLAKEDVEQTDEAATMQPKGPARVDVPAYKRINMKPLSLKDVVNKTTEKKSNRPNAVKEESEQLDELSKSTLKSYIKGRGETIHADRRDSESSRDKAYDKEVQGNKRAANDWHDEADWLKNRARKGAKNVAKAVVKVAKKNEEVELDEAKGSYELYHSQYSGAVHHGLAHHASKEGLSVHDDDYHQHVSIGPRKPAEGETVSHHLPAKDEKGNDHMIHMQIHNKGGDNKPYELNTYSSKVPKRQVKEESEQIDELSKKTLKSYINKSVHDDEDARGERSVKADRVSGVVKASYRTQGLAHKKGTDGFRKYKAESVESIDERELSSGETAEKERIVHGMKKGLSGFKARYGSRAKEVMYATATKKAKE